MFKRGIPKNLIAGLIKNGKIKTTESKAKKIRGLVDRVIVRVKQKKLKDRLLLSILTPELIKKLTSEVAPKFADRKSGFTRIIKLDNRKGDNAPMALVTWVEEKPL